MPAPPPDGYAALHAGFRWHVPEHFNIAQVCCGRWAERPDATKNIAIKVHSTGTQSAFHSYSDLQAAANRLSNVLATLGVQRGDRVAIVLPQRFETAVAYIAVLQMGAVAMPLSTLFGPEALEYRLHDSEARVALCDAASIDSLEAVRDDCPLLTSIIGIDAAGARADVDYAQALAHAPAEFHAVTTFADEAAVLIYTSGTTGQPKGALIPHRALIGNLTGFVCSQNWFGFDPFDAAAPSARRVLEPGRLGLDRRADGRAAAHAVLSAGPSLRYNGRFSPELAYHVDAAARRDAYVSVPHRAQGHDEGLPPAAQTVQAETAAP